MTGHPAHLQAIPAPAGVRTLRSLRTGLGGDAKQIPRSYILPIWQEKGRRVRALASGTHSRISVPKASPLRGLPVQPAQWARGAWGEPTDLSAGLLSGQLRCAGLSLVPPTSEHQSRETRSRLLTHRPTNRPTSGPTGSGRGRSPRDGGGDPRETREARPGAPAPRPPPFPRDRPSATPPPSRLRGSPQGPNRQEF